MSAIDLLFAAGFAAFVGGLWLVAPWIALVAGGLVLMGVSLSAAASAKGPAAPSGLGKSGKGGTA